MAGIYDRLTAESAISPHAIFSGIVAYAEAIFTKSQILAGINATLATPLTAAEITDLEAIADAIDAEGTLTAKMRYLNKVHAFNMAVQSGMGVSEVVYRAQLGI